MAPPGESHLPISPPATSLVLIKSRSPQGLVGINFQDAYVSRDEVSPEAPSPPQAANWCPGCSCDTGAARWLFLLQGRAWNLGENFADKEVSAVAIQYGRGAWRPQPSSPGGSPAPRQAATPVQADLDAPPTSQPERSMPRSARAQEAPPRLPPG